MKVKEESEKVGLKLNIQKTKIMASGPITSWWIDGETMESKRLYFGGLQNHCNGDCSHEIKRCLLLGRKAMPNLDSILKSRDITLPKKVRLVKAMVFPVVRYGCKSWTINKVERWSPCNRKESDMTEWLNWYRLSPAYDDSTTIFQLYNGTKAFAFSRNYTVNFNFDLFLG